MSNIKAAIRALNLETSSKILVAGCGYGAEMMEIRCEFSDIHGTDLSVSACALCTGLGSVTQSDIQNLCFRGNCFDLVICSEVIEHLHSPRKALKEFYRVLKATGFLILTTPNTWSINGIVKTVLDIHSGGQPIDIWPSPSTLMKMVRDNGFLIVLCKTFSHFPQTYLNRGGIVRGISGPGAVRLSSIVELLMSKVGSLTGYLILLVARKNIASNVPRRVIASAVFS